MLVLGVTATHRICLRPRVGLPARSLERALGEVGLDADAIAHLKVALEQDKQDRIEGMGPKTERWLGKTIASLGRVGLKVGTDVATGVITQVIKGYLGMP